MYGDETASPVNGSGGHRRAWMLGSTLAVLGLLGLAAGIRSYGAGDGKAYLVTARVELRGAPCRSHPGQCAVLEDGGSVVIYGPELSGVASLPTHRVRLDGDTTAVRVKLRPGRYLFAFEVAPPWSILLPNFGDGSFNVTSSPVDLGVVRPSPAWTVQGD